MFIWSNKYQIHNLSSGQKKGVGDGVEDSAVFRMIVSASGDSFAGNALVRL